MNVDIRFGINGLRTSLERLPKELMNAAEKACLRAGAGPIMKAAKANAAKSKDTGLLQKSIGIRVQKVNKRFTARIGPRKGMRQEVTRTDKRTGKTYKEIADPNNYSHLVEYGTTHSAAKPFIRPAIDSAGDMAVAFMAHGLQTHLTAVAARLAKRK